VVSIALGARDVTISPSGWSRIWTMRSQIRFPLSSIRAVHRAPADAGRGIWHGWRLPGTHVPGVLVAGSYYRGGRWEFWDVRVSKGRAIELELEDAPYSRVVVDVADPAFEVERLRAAAQRRSSNAR
jgi:hypothetical protein